MHSLHCGHLGRREVTPFHPFHRQNRGSPPSHGINREERGYPSPYQWSEAPCLLSHNKQRPNARGSAAKIARNQRKSKFKVLAVNGFYSNMFFSFFFPFLWPVPSSNQRYRSLETKPVPRKERKDFKIENNGYNTPFHKMISRDPIFERSSSKLWQHVKDPWTTVCANFYDFRNYELRERIYSISVYGKPAKQCKVVKSGDKPKLKRINDDKSDKNTPWHPHKAQWKLETKSSQRSSPICEEQNRYQEARYRYQWNTT